MGAARLRPSNHWFSTLVDDHRLAFVSSNVISILAALLGLYACVQCRKFHRRFRPLPRCPHSWGLIVISVSVFALAILIAIRFSLTWTSTSSRSLKVRLSIASDAVILFSLLLSLFSQRSQIYIGSQPETTAFWFAILLSLGITSYVSLIGREHIHYAYMVGTCCSFIIACAIFSWQSLLPRIPYSHHRMSRDDFAQGTDQDLEEYTTLYDRASFFSIASFAWVWPLLKLGYGQILTEKDWPELQKGGRSFFVRQDFETLWYEERTAKQRSLFRVLIKLVWRDIAVSGLLGFVAKICVATLMPLQVYLFIRYLDDYSTNSKTSILPGILLASSFAVFRTLETSILSLSGMVANNATVKILSSLMNHMFQSIFKASSGRQAAKAGDYINLISADIERIQVFCSTGQHDVNDVWIVPVQLIIYTTLLTFFLGAFAVVPVVMFIGVMVISYPGGRLSGNALSRAAESRGERSKMELDVIRNVRTVKLGACEQTFESRLVSRRKNLELPHVFRHGCIQALTWAVLEHYPVLVAAITFACFAFWSQTALTPEIIFPCWQVMTNLEFPLKHFNSWMSHFQHFRQAILRIQEIIALSEIDEKWITYDGQLAPGTIKLVNATFAYEEGEDMDILKGIDFEVGPGEAYCLIGRVGAGKSSLCEAILGQLITRKGRVQKAGRVAYIAQHPWLYRGSIKENIILGNPFRQDFYEQTIKACALNTDFDTFPKKDLALVGEEGVQLSGGQKARVALARAVYAQADIYIVDDVLAAVDQNTVRHLVEEVLGRSGILKDRTRLFVSNHVALILETDRIALLEEGRIVEQCDTGSVPTGSKIERFSTHLHRNAQDNPSSTKNEDENVFVDETSTPQNSGGRRKVSYDDEHFTAALGTIKSLKRYVKYLGVPSVVTFAIMMVLSFLGYFLTPLWLQYWSEKNSEKKANEQVGRWFLIGLGLFLWGAVLIFSEFYLLYSKSVGAGTLIYQEMIHALLHTPLQLIESLSSGQIINRLSGDLYSIDVRLLEMAVFTSAGWIFTVEVIAYLAIVQPALIGCAAFAVPAVFYIMKVFLATSSQVKRGESITRGSLFAQIKECRDGRTTILAYQKVSHFMRIFEGRVDAHLQTSTAILNSLWWMTIRTRGIASMFVFLVPMSIIWDLYHRRDVSPARAAASINISLLLQSILRQLVQTTSDFATKIIALDRCFEYADLPCEQEDDACMKTPEGLWPSKGEIAFENVDVRYGPDLNLALNGIVLRIKHDQRIGVVGRTGAGKSTLMSCLLRIIKAEQGRILIDGIDISTIKLSALRKSLAIVPQDAALFMGTLRYNLDLESQYDDAEIYEALERCQIRSFVDSLPVGLDTEISDGGATFSQGQRQLLTMARVFLSNARILILDEATASVDPETDSLIQASLKELSKGRTVLIIAHRIDTIFDTDRIVVLDGGRIVEDGQPQELMQRRGAFYKLSMEREAVK